MGKETQEKRRRPYQQEASEGTTPASMLISGFRPPERGGKIFLLFEPTQFVVLSYSSLAGQYRAGSRVSWLVVTRGQWRLPCSVVGESVRECR